jgi:2-dehydropantoate 2-reductase
MTTVVNLSINWEGNLVTTHGVLGPGGIGGLIGGALARAGADVIVVPRPGREHPDSLTVRSTVLGEFTAPVTVARSLTQPVNVLWVCVKNQQLDEALASVTSTAIPGALVIPLMNGIDHLARLRAAFPEAEVVAGAIRTESTRVAAGTIVHGGWHVQAAPPGEVADPASPTKPVQLAPKPHVRDRAAAVAQELEAAGVPTQLWDDEDYLLWSKLSILCPYALATTAVLGPIGMVRADVEVLDLLVRCATEVADVAQAVGVVLDRERIGAMLTRFPDEMRVSMERDASAGVPIEIEAVTAPVLRNGAALGVDVDATRQLRDRALAAVAGSPTTRSHHA